MKTAIVLFSLATIGASFVHNGISRCAINKRHYLSHFLTRNEKEIYDKLLQSKDDEIHDLHILAKSKDELLKLKDETIKWKDELLKWKDDEIHIIAKLKDETIKWKDKLLKWKDDEIHIIAKSKDETIKWKDELLKMRVEALSTANAEIFHLQGRLTLRSVFEKFELRYVCLLDPGVSTKGNTKRENVWKAIIEKDASGIMQHLGDTTTDWPLVAISLYKLMPKDVHNDSWKKVIIDEDIIGLTDEMTKLAVTVCKIFPIKFEII